MLLETIYNHHVELCKPIDGQYSPTNYNLVVVWSYPLIRRYGWQFVGYALRRRCWQAVRAGLAALLAHTLWKGPLLDAPYVVRRLVLDKRGGNFGSVNNA